LDVQYLYDEGEKYQWHCIKDPEQPHHIRRFLFFFGRDQYMSVYAHHYTVRYCILDVFIEIIDSGYSVKNLGELRKLFVLAYCENNGPSKSFEAQELYVDVWCVSSEFLPRLSEKGGKTAFFEWKSRVWDILREKEGEGKKEDMDVAHRAFSDVVEFNAKYIGTIRRQVYSSVPWFG